MIIEELQKDSELAPSIDFSYLRKTLIVGSKQELLNQSDQACKYFQHLISKICILKQIEHKKLALDEETNFLKLKKTNLAKLYQNFTEGAENLKAKTEALLAEPNISTPTSFEIVQYASRINGIICAPIDYKTDDQFLPLSFGINKVSFNEIDSSILALRYKQNKSYKKCQMPFIKILNDTEKNITKNFRGSIRVKNFIYLQALPSDEDMIRKLESNPVPPKIVFTKDGSVPSLHNYVEGSAELIYVSKDTTLKFRTIRNGYIDSDVLEMNIQVEEGGEAIEFSPQKMDRPNLKNLDVDENNNAIDYIEDMFVNDNFVSWQDSGNYSTPRD